MSTLQKKFIRNIFIALGVLVYVILLVCAIHSTNVILLLLVMLPFILAGLFICYAVIAQIISMLVMSWRVRGVLTAGEWEIYQQYQNNTHFWTHTDLFTQSEKEMTATISMCYNNPESIEIVMRIWYKLRAEVKYMKNFIFFD